MAIFNVTQTTDNGKGDTVGTLSYAILLANTTSGDDTIDLNTDVRMTGRMQELINSNINIFGNNHKLSGDANGNGTVDAGDVRPLFVLSGTVEISNLTMTNGLAKGRGASDGAGSGAGMGGALFIYDGAVSLNNVTLNNNKAIGGGDIGDIGGVVGIDPTTIFIPITVGINGTPGSGFLGTGGTGGTGTGLNGAFSSNGGIGRGGNGGTGGSSGGNGGSGGIGTGGSGGFSGDGGLGQGGNGGVGGGASGFLGAGGKGIGGNGGFGGGGGNAFGGLGINAEAIGGAGGFGGGGGFGNTVGVAGFGGAGGFASSGASGNGGGAGFGGAIFIRSGSLNLTNTTLTNNIAIGGASANGGEGKGLGGGIFAMNSLTNTNGNNQGMPTILPKVTSINTTYAQNSAYNDSTTENTYGSITLAVTPSPTRNDFNGDGKSDILWRNDNGNIALWQMNGTTVTTTSTVATAVPTAWQIAGTGDFNGDRKAEILWRNTTDGNISIGQYNPITAPPIVGAVPTALQVASTGDFNGDGKSDILWRNTNGDVSIWQMNGTASNSQTVIANVTTDWKISGTGDFNGDGKADILWRNDDGSIALWQMNGSALLSPTSLTSTPSVDSSWKINGIADFNGDGKSDILWRNDNGQVAVWTMDGATALSKDLTNPNSSVDNSWKITGTSDFNSDGKADILWRNNDGSTAIWEMNGATIASSSLTSVPIVDNSWKIAVPIL
jgi:FG-GAP-like repeat/FG-GAP repeat